MATLHSTINPDANSQYDYVQEQMGSAFHETIGESRPDANLYEPDLQQKEDEHQYKTLNLYVN